MTPQIQHCIRTAALLGAACLALGAQARDGVSWTVGIASGGMAVSMGHASAVMVPGPVVVAPAVVMAPRPVMVQAPVVAVIDHHPERHGKRHHKHGHGWHRKHDRHAHGRSDYWHYGAAPQATVVVQGAQQVWVR